VAASATTAVAPTVRKRPTAQVVSIDQAQRAGKYQRGAKPTDQPVGTNGQPPPWTSLRNRAASRQLTGNHQPGTRASRIRGELAPVVRLYRRQDHQVDRMDAEQCSEQEEHDPARRASRPGSSWSVGFAFMEPYYHQQDGPAGQFPSERDAAWGPACGHHRFYAAVLSPRPRAVVARARYLAMLVATTRLRASECRAENRAIAVALMITGFRRWFAGVQPAQLTRRFKAKLFNRLRETAECMAADGRQKPCLCPSSRRSLTRSVIPAPRRPSPP
jgi:hypothetical protein